VTSLLGCGPGVRGLEVDPGLGGPLRDMASFSELFLFLANAPGANAGSTPPCTELVSDGFLLLSFAASVPYSSPKKPCSFLWNLPLKLDLDPEDETVVALAMEGLRSALSSGKAPPFGGTKPGES